MRVLVSGFGGFMGREVSKLAREGCRGAVLAALAAREGERI